MFYIIERDLAGLEETVQYALKNTERTTELAEEGIRYFDSYASPEAQALYILRTMGIPWERPQ
jgi:hypothetical protein